MDSKQTLNNIPDKQMLSDAESSWKDLPSAVLCHILTIIPYKRADVKAVCCSWRQAINSSITEVKLPEADLQLLVHLPNVIHLKTVAKRHQQHIRTQQKDAFNLASEGLPYLNLSSTCSGTWPPRSSSSVAAAHPGCTDEFYRSINSDCSEQAAAQQQVTWPAGSHKLYSQLLSLSLVNSSTAALQLAASLTDLLNNRDAALQYNATFTRLKSLELCGIQCLEPLLQALLQLQQKQLSSCSQPSRSTCNEAPSLSSTAQPASRDQLGTAFCQLEELKVDVCLLTAAECQQLVLLLQHLPSLRVLHLPGCQQLWSVSEAVCGCSGLTKLVLSSIECLREVPEQISQLTNLQVLDMSGNATLRSLGSSFSRLTSLRSLSLSGPSGLWLDYSFADQSAAAAAAVASSNAPASTPSNSAAAARAALPQLLLPALPHQQQLLLLSDLRSLTNLETLNLSHNRQLMVVPGSVSVLTNFKVLDVTGCGVRWLNDEVMECAGLQQLLLGDNVLAEVPDDITRLTNLKVLDLSACCSLWSLPRSLVNMQSLERLIVAFKAVGQHVIEQLELRGSGPVDVVIQPGDNADDVDDDFADVRLGSWGEGGDEDDDSSDTL